MKVWQKRASRVLPAIVAAVALGLLVACAGGPSRDRSADLVRTWARARVILPNEIGGGRVLRMDSPALGRRLADYRGGAGAGAGAKLPVVLYLHGCTGLGQDSFAFMRALAAAGYAVIAPDSMARRFRPWQCDPKTKSGGFHLYVYEFRLAEISYALERLDMLDWVNPSRLYLIGVSEGGVAAALYRGAEFRARVIAQWTCHGGALIRGLLAPPNEPVLAVVRRHDPWYDPARTRAQTGDCGAFLGNRPGSRSLVLEQGTGHDVLKDATVRDAIIAFLKQAP